MSIQGFHLNLLSGRSFRKTPPTADLFPPLAPEEIATEDDDATLWLSRATISLMRIFVAGATGVIGVRVVPLLLEAGHRVAGMTRSQRGVVEELGAEPVVCDVYEAEALARAVRDFAPDLVLNELTDLPDELEQLEASRSANRRMRTEGTRNLLAAAGDTKMVAQSTAFPAGTEEHERLVLGAGGVILRYGRFYGPSTWQGDEPPPPPRIHVDEAARRTLDALDAPSGTTIEIAEPR